MREIDRTIQIPTDAGDINLSPRAAALLPLMNEKSSAEFNAKCDRTIASFQRAVENRLFAGKDLLEFMKTPTQWQQPNVNGSITVSEPEISIITEEYDNDLPETCKMYLKPKYIID